jgi:hypothetical protein
MKKVLALTSLLFSLNSLALEVHEWGTFTSVVGSDGQIVQGLHHEEEALPNFVYDLSKLQGTNPFPQEGPGTFRGLPPMTRGFIPESMDQMPIPTFTERITQKMETPVLYFYDDKEVQVKVRVDFPRGIISQWFPKATEYNPSKKAEDGYAVWDIKVLNLKEAPLPPTSGNSIWNPSRKTNANIVKVDDELEKLIFYRGLADFKTDLEVTNDGKTLTLKNNSDYNISGIVILDNRENELGIRSVYHIDSLSSQNENQLSIASQNIDDSFTFKSYEGYLSFAKARIIKELVESGLFEDEANAMVGTWEKGYFKTKGIRVLYVLSRQETDEILPIEISPTPKKLVRTLVGRVEVLTPEDEAATENFIENLLSFGAIPTQINGREMTGLGHFPEPKLQRLLQTSKNEKVIKKAKEIIQTMNRGMIN